MKKPKNIGKLDGKLKQSTGKDAGGMAHGMKFMADPGKMKMGKVKGKF